LIGITFFYINLLILTSWSLFIVIKIMFHSKLFIFFLLFNFIFGSYGTSYAKQKLPKVFKPIPPIPPEYDNRYVWFTRDVHGELTNSRRQTRMKDLNKTSYRNSSSTILGKIFSSRKKFTVSNLLTN